MGFFGSYVFDGNAWHGYDPDSDQIPDVASPWLSVDIHDSDIATVRYEPAGPGSGTAYLGFTPRMYFGSESALDLPTCTAKLRAWHPGWPGSRAEAMRPNFGV